MPLAANLLSLVTASSIGIVTYQSPVSFPIVNHFDLPLHKWDAGNRGVDYSPPAGTAVTAAADGTVTFSGQVGGQLFVVLRHADGTRTTYAYLAGVTVRQGDAVLQGEQLGVTGTSLHFGARVGDQYVDPEALLARRGHAYLVPTVDTDQS